MGIEACIVHLAASSSFTRDDDRGHFYAATHAFSEVALASTPVTPMDRYIAEVNRNFSRTDFEGLLLMPKEQALSLLCGSDGSGTSVETGDTTIDADPPRPSLQQLS